MLLTLEALEEATQALWDSVADYRPNTIMMRKDVADWCLAIIKQGRQLRAARRHPMLRHMTNRQFERRVRVKKIPYPKQMPSDWLGWSA